MSTHHDRHRLQESWDTGSARLVGRRMMPAALAAAYRGRPVLVTGHTGFKGSWLCLWLQQLGARVTGLALPPDGQPSLFEAIGLEELVTHKVVDVRDPVPVRAAMAAAEPEIVFHLAAQSLVRRSYREPLETYMTNVMGTAHVLDAVRHTPSIRAVVVVTSDKCYESREWDWGYREIDAMGGTDPYSSSKGAAELIVAAYRRSYFANGDSAQIGSGRAGNVIGGGDWSEDRLVPDIVRAAVRGKAVVIRNPTAVRPWQHVLEPLHGYLELGVRLMHGGAGWAEGWNFGPEAGGMVDVGTLAELVVRAWGTGAPPLQLGTQEPQPHETRVLRLDISKAAVRFGWRPVLDLTETVALTVDWYKAHAFSPTAMRAFTERQIEVYMARRATETPPGEIDAMVAHQRNS
jgi:CDP-glucose 4,6-dehydratase